MILVLDATHLCRTFYEVAKHKDDLDLDDVTERFLNRIEKVREMLSRHELEHCICVFDNQKKTFRHWLYPEYKSGREVDEAWIETEDRTKWAVSRSSDWMTVIASYGFEADDVIASIAAQKRDKVIVHAVDKDLHQCLEEGRVTMCKDSKIHAKRHAPVLEFFTAGRLQKEFGFGPDRWIDYQCLVGDGCDTIKGAEGVGDKTAKTLIAEHASIEDIDPDSLNSRQAAGWDDFLTRLPMIRALVTLKTEMDMPAELPT